MNKGFVNKNRVGTLMRKLLLVVAAVFMIFLCACEEVVPAYLPEENVNDVSEVKLLPEGRKTVEESIVDSTRQLDPEEYYYDLESVVLYLDTYGELPLNFITKDEAKKRGWEGGSVEDYIPDAAIGGDFYGNYEKKLPGGKGVEYHECDLDTHGYKNRGSRRLIYSNDGKYYYTRNHYDTFREVTLGEAGIVLGDEF